MPRSSARRRAAIAASRSSASICQVPMPITGTGTPASSRFVTAAPLLLRDLLQDVAEERAERVVDLLLLRHLLARSAAIRAAHDPVALPLLGAAVRADLPRLVL